ncbi:MAG TPA: hypothetical protein VIJ07_04585 [Dermatophilaceae bacterium]|jgi:hypothetical protein
MIRTTTDPARTAAGTATTATAAAAAVATAAARLDRTFSVDL